MTLQSDYAKTGKLYKKLDSYKMGVVAGGRKKQLNYFGSSAQFKTCKSFKAFLESKYLNEKFKVLKA